MKQVLVFGDSQTWGTNPETKVRYEWPDRWPGAMAETLGEEWDVIEQGLRGRTTTAQNPHSSGRSGRMMLPMLLESHAPLDAVIIMLGTNDISRIIGRNAVDASWGCAALIDIVRHSRCGPAQTAPRVLLVAPPPVRASQGRMVLIYDGREAESNRLAEAYEMVAKRFGAEYFDASSVVQSSDADGVHPDRAANRKLGQHLAAHLIGMFTEPSPQNPAHSEPARLIPTRTTPSGLPRVQANPVNKGEPLP